MNRTPVTSSQLSAVGYDAETQKMEVQFKNGSVYEYDGVSASDHQALVSAPSVGQHFNKHVKYGFTYKRL